MSAVETLDVYRRLNSIKEYFRILKINVGLRPIFVYTKPRIKGYTTV